MSADNPLLAVWLHPRRTVRAIIEQNPEYGVIPLMCLFGIVRSLDRASFRSAGDHLPLPVILGLAVVVGPLGGLFMLWLGSHVIRWTGRWLGGTGPRDHIKTAIAWSSVPTACILVLWVPELILFGEELFTTETPRLEESLALMGVFLAFAAVEMALGVWSLVLTCHSIAEVQGYTSAWRGLGNLMLSGLVIVVPIVLLVVPFVLLRS